MIFRASYEDVAKLEAEARKQGWAGNGSCYEYVDSADYRIQTRKSFAGKDEAVAWIMAAISGRRTVFGAGDVDAIETIERAGRCRYCTCRGMKTVHHYVVSDKGIDFDEATDDDCHSG